MLFEPPLMQHKLTSPILFSFMGHFSIDPHLGHCGKYLLAAAAWLQFSTTAIFSLKKHIGIQIFTNPHILAPIGPWVEGILKILNYFTISKRNKLVISSTTLAR